MKKCFVFVQEHDPGESGGAEREQRVHSRLIQTPNSRSRFQTDAHVQRVSRRFPPGLPNDRNPGERPPLRPKPPTHPLCRPKEARLNPRPHNFLFILFF